MKFEIYSFTHYKDINSVPKCINTHTEISARRSKRGICYGNVAGWLAGWVDGWMDG